MAGAKLVCRVCGKEYEACRSARVSNDAFRWQDVACSKECGDIYFKRVLEARGKIATVVNQSELAVDSADQKPDTTVATTTAKKRTRRAKKPVEGA